MIQVNAMGHACPIPVVKTKNAIRELGGAGTVVTLVDNEIAVQNLQKGPAPPGRNPASPSPPGCTPLPPAPRSSHWVGRSSPGETGSCRPGNPLRRP